MIDLSRDYPCVMGAPVLRSVDPAIFTLRYFADCLDCGFCHDACCDHGVDVDVDNAARLKSLPEEFHARIGVPAAQWFTTDVIRDTEFPGGAHLRTALRDGACVFRNHAGRGCAIHAYCLKMGLDYHLFKPLVSTLFPVTFEKGVLTVSSEAAEGSLICGRRGASLYDGARGELLYYFGSGLIAELDGLKRGHDRGSGL